VLDWKAPVNVKGIQSFLGLANYYRKFIPNFSEIAAPLTQLTKKGIAYVWGDRAEAAFQALKVALTRAPVLRHPDPNREFIFSTDASLNGIGVVVQQEFDDGRHPVRYASRSLSKEEKKWAIRELEALAIIWAVEEFRTLIDCVPFTVETDHGSLKWLLETKTPGRLNRWALRLQEFIPYMTIVYKPGDENGAADALSRKHSYCPIDDPQVVELCQCEVGEVSEMHEELHQLGVLTRDPALGESCCCEQVRAVEQWEGLEPSCLAACQEFAWLSLCAVDIDKGLGEVYAKAPFIPGGRWGKHFRLEQERHPFYGKAIKFLEGTLEGKEAEDIEDKVRNYELSKGFLCRWVTTPISKRKKREAVTSLRVVVPTSLVSEVLDLSHKAPAAAHAKTAKMIGVLRRRFWWPGMREDVVTRKVLSRLSASPGCTA
jgi:hypothetical protein